MDRSFVLGGAGRLLGAPVLVLAVLLVGVALAGCGGADGAMPTLGETGEVEKGEVVSVSAGGDTPAG